MANSSSPWAAYRALMACCLVVLDKSSGVRPMGIGDMLRRALDKLVMREAGDQAKTACGNLQLCADLDACVEGATHAVGQPRLDRVRGRWREEAAGSSDKEEGGVIVEILNNLNIETAGTEE